MATVTKPIALDESINTTESPSRNLADVLAQELSGIASAITGGSDNVPKTDVATVEPSNTASRSYSVGELVYVNGNLYKVIASISQGSAFTVGTNIQSTTVSGALGEGDRGSVSVTADGTKTFAQLFNSLYALVDMSKVSATSRLEWNTGSSTLVFYIRDYSSSQIRLYQFLIGTSNGSLDTVIISNSSAYYRCDLSTTIAYTNRSNNTSSNGQTFTFYY